MPVLEIQVWKPHLNIWNGFGGDLEEPNIWLFEHFIWYHICTDGYNISPPPATLQYIIICTANFGQILTFLMVQILHLSISSPIPAYNAQKARIFEGGSYMEPRGFVSRNNLLSSDEAFLSVRCQLSVQLSPFSRKGIHQI